MRISAVFNGLLAVVALALLHHCDSAAIQRVSPYTVRLFRRSETGVYTRVDVAELSALDPSTAGLTARRAQINYIGELARARNATEWYDYQKTLQDKYLASPDPMIIATDSPLAPIARVIVIGIVMMIFSSLCTVCFCCLRCCNQCGGRKPSPEGYSKEQIFGHVAALLLFTVLTIAFAILTYAFAAELVQVPTVGHKGALALLDSADEFVENTKGGLSAAPDSVIDSSKSLIDKLLNTTLPRLLNETFDPVVNTLVADLVQLGTDVNSGKTLFNSSLILVNEIKEKTQQIPPILNSITAQMAAISAFKVQTSAQNYSFSIAGLPDISSLTSIALPDTNSIPDLSGYLTSMNDVPDLAALAATLRSTYYNLTSGLPTMVNDTFSGMRSGPQAQINDALSNLNASLTDSAQVPIRKLRADVDTAFADPQITSITTSATQGFMVFALIISVPLVISFIGALLRRSGAMHATTCLMLFIPFFIWLLFVIFYIFALPFTAVCNSMESVTRADYDLTSQVSGFLPIQGFEVNPAVFLDGCKDGHSIFDSPINNNNMSVVTIIRDNSRAIINKTGVNSLINAKQLKDMVKLPDLTSNTDMAKNINLDAFNVSALNIPALNLNYSTTTLVQDMNNTVFKLQPVDFDASLGNVTTMQAKIVQFNADCKVQVPAFAGWTYAFISTTYAELNSPVFDPVTISGDSSNNTKNGLIAQYFGNMFPSVAFIYQCNKQLDVQKQRVSNLTTTIVDLQAKQIDVIQSDISQLRVKVTDVTVVVNDTIASINTLVSHIPLVSNATDLFIDLVVNVELTSLLETVLNLLVDTVLLGNPVSGFGQCKYLAQSLDYNKEVVCTVVANGLSGIWFCSMLTGIFLILTCVTSLRSKKRIEYLEILNKVGDSKGKKSGGFGGPGVVEGMAEVGDILKSAPVADTRDMNDEELAEEGHVQESYEELGAHSADGQDDNAHVPEYDGGPYTANDEDFGISKY